MANKITYGEPFVFNDRMLPTLVLVNIVGTVGIVGIAARWRRR